ncbi:MAG: class I SAM-dependent methyltransferase [Mycobacterium sp.]|nr:class I SAM-dependent methyltransferase [Mycobacterium sp.]
MTEPDFLTATRAGYDRAAAAYADRFHDHLDGKPLDRAMVHAFAGMVVAGGTKPVIDVGCGTGSTTAMLRSGGAQVFGVDLSPGMLAQARRLNPDLGFVVGSMTDLPIADGAAGGICAWYSIIHIPDERLDGVLREFHRVLAPGGLVLLAFQVGDRPRILTSAFDQDVELTFVRRQPREVRKRLADNGFALYAELDRDRDDDGFESTPHAYLIARRVGTAV